MQQEENRETKIILVQNKSKQSQAFKRMNFLFKASRMFQQVNQTYSRHLLYEFLQVGEKRVIRMYCKKQYRNKTVKKQYCKRCIAFMRARVIKSRQQDNLEFKGIRRVCSKCYYCKRIKPL